MEIKNLKNFNIKYLQEEFGNQLQSILLKDEKTVLAFFNFAKALGCFESKKLVNFSGNETNTVVGQKASLFLKNIINDGIVNIYNFSNYFANFEDVSYSPNLLNFLTMQEGKDQYKMLNTLLDLENEKNGSILSVVKNFDLIKSMRKTLDKNGKPAKLSWENAIRRFNNVKKYDNVSGENVDIAELFLKQGLTQSTFDLASKLKEQAKENKIKKHILNVELKENSMREQIDDLQKQSNDNNNLIKEIYNKKFTFEFLSKHDPINYILGLYTDCCATISSKDYGQKITKSAILSNNVQNIIVKNENGDFIAKATIYINKNAEYAVINEFDINLKYRDNEIITQDNKGGWYSTEKSSEGDDRQKIFNAFVRAIESFVTAYNKENSEHKLKKVNVGMGHNKLKHQLTAFRKENNILEVPEEFGFNDAKYSQYVLLENTKKHEINQGFEK